MSIHLKDRVKAMSLDLPPAPKPSGVYRPILVVDNPAVALANFSASLIF